MTDRPSPPSSHEAKVVAGILRDAEGRILLAQRTRGEHAGRWEYPGGKAEPGESLEEALRRELEEELGVVIGGISALIEVPQTGARGPWRLCAFEVQAFKGEAHGREGQALAWVAAERLRAYSMPPADLPVTAALLDPACYAITPDLAADRTEALVRGLDRLIAQGSPLRLQWRLPQWERSAAIGLLAAQLARLRAAGIEVLLNGEPDEARRLGCGLHLRSSMLATVERAELYGLDAITASCHDASELARAASLDLDAVLLGPVASTATHPGARPLGWEEFVALRARCALPIYALGGLVPEDLPAARACGAQGIAAIRGLWPDQARVASG
ncbi:Nudix family hydrolase [Pseudomarimonas salicorniae]|uniref:8-oxo-dGTP diphosphatase n=1 Tax=Pseudomarimonas salicorniae TaxID=2933270 RepID=A0ABT0GHC6_9GAMM|nr:Nudix family hydrolase [Lysobacter sp. CAU 1642]MCK7593949.1 Nudix family hydrolase [Lysobacter sp. CAU 1642]